MKRGFTLVELLVVIAIMGILAGVCITTYFMVSENIKQKTYENKIEIIKTNGLRFAEDNEIYLFDVKTLIQEGYLEADNILGEYLNPINNEDMSCYIVNIVYNDKQPEVSVIENDTCYDSDTLNEKYNFIELKLYEDKNKTKEIKTTGDGWTNISPLYVGFEFKDNTYKLSDIQTINWYGEKSLSCTQENLSDCNTYQVDAETIKELVVNLEATVKLANEKTYKVTNKKRVKIDKQQPFLDMNSLVLDNEVYRNHEKKLEISVSDRNGSGVKDYAFTTESNCENAEYKALNNNLISDYLPNGNFRICLRDNVLNEVVSETIEVKNVDTTPPEIKGFKEQGILYANSKYYKNLTINVSTFDKQSEYESGVMEVHYCVTTEEECEPNEVAKVNNSSVAAIDIDDNDEYQNICAVALDNAGNLSEKMCYGSFWKKENINIDDIKVICDLTNNYCGFENGIYVKYGKKTFTMYRSSNSSFYGYTGVNTTIPLINVTCCDSGKCHLKNIYSNDGVSKSLSGTFGELPKSRINYINLDTYRYGYVTSEDFGHASNSKEEHANTEHHITSFSLEELPRLLNDGYSYGLPSETLDDVECSIKRKNTNGGSNGKGQKYLKRLNLTSFGKNFSYTVGDEYTVKCYKDDLNSDEFEEISKDVTILENPDNIDTGKIEDGVDITTSNRLTMNPNIHNMMLRYGLLDIEEYQDIRGKKYADDLNTLLSTAINSVIYNRDNHTYGHDGVVSTISAIYASPGAYEAITPMIYGKRKAVMTVPFNKTVKIKSGIGTKSDPFVIE